MGSESLEGGSLTATQGVNAAADWTAIAISSALM